MKFKTPPLALIIMLSMPIIQLGYSYYISISFGIFLYSFLLSIKIFDIKIYISLILIGILFLLKSFINASETTGSREILIPIREMICFMALVFISSYIEKERFDRNLINKIVLTLLLLMLILVVYQVYKLSNGEYFGIPIEYFSQNKDTLIGVRDALLHQTKFRPTSFFGEPSYTAFIVLSLLVICYKTLESMKSKILYTICAFIIVSISQSLAGMLSIIFASLYWLMISKSSNIRAKGKLTLIAIFIVATIILLYLSEDIFSRLKIILVGRDDSINTRLSEPLSLLFNIISTGSIFGVNFQYINKYLGYVSLDNALLRIFIYYGALMIFPIIILFIYTGSSFLVLYIILTMNFNGDFFSYDKVLIVGMVIGLFKAKFIKLTKYDRHSSSLQSYR